MNVILDANAPDFLYANERAKRGDYVFVAQGDPRVQVQRAQGISHVRKNIASVWTTDVYDLDGESFVIPALDVLAFMKDVGVQQWDVARLSGGYVVEILAKWPGPVARRIETTVSVDDDTARRLRQWYVQRGTDWELAERPI